MSKVTVIRHAKSDYPNDALSLEGKTQAQSSKERFSGFSTVVCSPLKRSQQTAQDLGYHDFLIDPRLIEFDVDIQAQSDVEYAQRVNREYWESLMVFGHALLEAIQEYSQENSLLITHNAIISAGLRILTEETISIANLDGFEVNIHDGKIEGVKILSLNPKS